MLVAVLCRRAAVALCHSTSSSDHNRFNPRVQAPVRQTGRADQHDGLVRLSRPITMKVPRVALAPFWIFVRAEPREPPPARGALPQFPTPAAPRHLERFGRCRFGEDRTSERVTET